MRAIPIMLGALALASSTAAAQVGFLSGSVLLESCEDPARRPECARYIEGVLDAHSYDLSRFGNPRDFCIPEDMTIEELEGVVVKWLKDHPTKLRVTGGTLVVLALTDAFKCRGDRD